MRLTNRYNRAVYWLWSPIYDRLLSGFFLPGRRRAMAVADLAPGDRVLLVGVGTGADLPLLPPGVAAVGVDLSAAMLARARARLPLPDRDVALIAADALALPVADGEFDVAILNLILSVVPDPRRCLREALRAVRPGGRLVVFDKFLPDDARPGLGRTLANVMTTGLGTDINRRLGDLVAGQPCAVVRDEPSLLGGAYRVVLLRRT